MATKQEKLERFISQKEPQEGATGENEAKKEGEPGELTEKEIIKQTIFTKFTPQDFRNKIIELRGNPYAPVVKDRFGWLPTSLWDLPKDTLLNKIVDDTGPVRLLRRAETCKYLPGLKMSSFHPLLAARIYQYWGDPGCTVLDPMSGRSTRMVIASMMGYKYIGIEIEPSIYQELLNTKERLQRMAEIAGADIGEIDIRLGDGCKLAGIPDESIDLIASCPPFWSLEKYGQTHGQLSMEPSYESFLERMRECARNCFRVLKPHKFCCMVVADFRAGEKKRGTTFKLFHRDMIDIFEGAQFATWDLVTNKLLSPFTWSQISKVARPHVRYTSKMTEYILVFRKPIPGEI